MTVYIVIKGGDIYKVFADKKKAQAYVTSMREGYDVYLGIVEEEVE